MPTISRVISAATTLVITSSAQFANAAAQVSSEHFAPYASRTFATPDARYRFSGEWIKLAESQSGSSGASAHHDELGQAPAQAELMTIADTKYSMIGKEHISLQSGAMLVRAGRNPLFVSQSINGSRLITRIRGGSLAMISALGGNAIILNLTDRCCGALITYPPRADGKSHPMPILTGQFGEIFTDGASPESKVLATKVLSEERDKSGNVLLANCRYAEALRRYNLVDALRPEDLQILLKNIATLQ